MKYLNRTKKNKINSSSSNQNNRMGKVLVSNSLCYCDTCGKGIQKNPILCYIFVDYFCSKKCHVQKHEINQNI